MVLFWKCIIAITLYQGHLHVLGTIRYNKDMGMDIQFPPSVTRSSSKSLGPGHLRPLGYQRRPSGKVMNALKMPNPHEFNIKYIRPGKVVVLREHVKHLPVFNQWENDDYLDKQYGNVNVSVRMLRQDTDGATTPMTMKAFLNNYLHEDWYLQMTLPVEMAHDLHLPECLKCGSYNKRLQEAELWMSAGGTSSLLHNHEDHTLHCLLFGRKDIIVIEGDHKKEFSFKEKYPNAGAGFSTLDMQMINMFHHKSIVNVPWTYTTLSQGDCLFIPAGVLHQVRSYGRSLSYSILFSPVRTFDSSDCRRTDGQDAPLLEDVDFAWVYKIGTRTLSKETLQSSTLEHILSLLLRNDDSLHFERFKHFYDEAFVKAVNRPPASRAWGMLTSDFGQTKISRTQLMALSKSQISRLAKYLNDVKSGDITNKDEL